MKIACLGCLGLIALLLLAGAAAAYFVTRPPTEIQALPTVVVSEQAAARLDEKLTNLGKTLQEATERGEQAEISLTITEEELNSKIAQELQGGALAGPPMRDVQVHLAEDKIVATAKIDAGGFEVPVAVTAKVTVQDGKPQVTIEKTDLGRLPVPQAIKDQINSIVDSNISPALADMPIDLAKLKIEKGQISIEGLVKPK